MSNSTENALTGDAPAGDDPRLGLTIRPTGVEVYTDLERGKRFVRLSYRRRDVTRAKALAFVGEVIDDVTRAGLIITEAVKPVLSLGNSRAEMQTPGGRCDIAVEVAVRPLAEQTAENAAWVEAMRRRYGGKAKGQGEA